MARSGDQARRKWPVGVPAGHVTCAAGAGFGSGQTDLVVDNFSAFKPKNALTLFRNLGRRAEKAAPAPEASSGR